MGGVALRAEQQVDATPSVVYDLFGAGTGAGWVFDAVCDRVEPGASVSIRAPLGGPDPSPVELLGRLSRVRRPHLLEIRHEQPWRGHVRLHLDRAGTGTRVRLVAELDERGVAWLLRRHGHPVRDAVPAGSHRVGLLTTKSGPGGVFAVAAENAAELAREEIDGEGGVLGRPLHLAVGDDATDPATGVSEARRLVRAGCRTILVSTTSATFVAVSAALAGTGVLLVHTLMNEGGIDGPLRVQLGERPTDQLATATGPMMARAGGRRWFLAGNDYLWPHRCHAAAREVIPAAGGLLVGERFAPIGTRDFSPLVEAVAASGADLVLSTFVGADAVAFERQCHAMGLRDRTRTLSLAMDESTLAYVGSAAAAGISGVSGYFQDLPTSGNEDLVRRYRAAYGPWAPPLSTLSESVYEALRMYVAAVRHAGEDDPYSIAREMRTAQFELPRGTVTLDGTGAVAQRLYLADAAASTFRVSFPG
jgi:branched-chain amino acid transport system substrate-binding protein